MDIITIVFREEINILKLQAQSIDLYCQQLNIGKIIVVINDPTLDISEINPSWWGRLKDSVVVINRGAWNVEYVDNGWVSQQALKLASTTLGSSTHSIILDAKTLFVKPVSLTDVFDNNNCSKLGQLPIYPIFETSQKITENLFNIKIDYQLGPGGVPFVVDNSQVSYMIHWIESKTGQNFLVWFQEQGMLTEFILYAGWIIRVNGSLDHVSNKNNTFGIICNLCHSQVGLADSKLQEMQFATTVSIHRRAWSQLSNDQHNKYRNFLISRNISQAKDLI